MPEGPRAARTPRTSPRHACLSASAHPPKGPLAPSPAPQTAPARPASPGCGRLEAPQHRRGRSRSRRWSPLRAPRDAPLVVILPSSRDALGSRSFESADRLMQGPNVAWCQGHTVPTSLQPSTGTVENRRVLAARGRAPHPALHAELGTRPPVTLVYQVLRKNNRASNQLAECLASTSRPQAAVTVGLDSPPGSPEPPAHEGPPTEAAAGPRLSPRPAGRRTRSDLLAGFSLDLAPGAPAWHAQTVPSPCYRRSPRGQASTEAHGHPHTQQALLLLSAGSQPCRPTPLQLPLAAAPDGNSQQSPAAGHHSLFPV
ncbi:uncharacterized protein LOC114196617 [Eumetopias jubatus]|uniref:uncharacterized protein LOC114196617 n=1 Tax=Eumetopias jubatus TaxID=34886 RepID=UPI00101678C6|nr:uncharacterized protein LOC114196617 [Eumetopias jubatus]